ncbi:MAG: hypothetical protein J7480_04080 [Microbacteriaceae bacterium]|nr:hypothetical protein [Microbacteriaceae bacterium]
MSTPEPTASSTIPAYVPATKPEKPKEPPITGGQRASAILAGLAGHVLFAIGWFGIAFVILGQAVSPLVNDLLANLLGDTDAQRFTEILTRASALFWLLGLVFLVGSAAFVVFGILSSLLILRRGGIGRPGRVNWTSFVIAAVIDLPLFLLTLWITTLVTDDSAGLLWLPPVLALILAAAIGVVVWWWMAHVNRGAPKPKPAKPGKKAA